MILQKWFLLVVIGLIQVIVCFPATAGNQDMVEKNVEELDELNKAAVRQIPDLPKNGKVELEADVSYKGGKPIFDIYYKKITTEKEQDIHFNKGNTTNKKMERRDTQ